MPNTSFSYLPFLNPQAPLVLLGEHASNTIPPPLSTAAEDERWLGTHWAWDIGIANVIRTVGEQMGCAGVLANFSRLVCDPNRDVEDEFFIRTELEGRPLSFNQALNPQEVQRRIDTYYAPYHRQVEKMIQERLTIDRDFLVFSIHSFTPNYLGEKRDVEVGVLFDEFVEEAEIMHRAFQKKGFDTRLNEPWSGADGMMFSPHLHGTAHGLINLELEIRQDLITAPEQANAFGITLAEILTDLCRQRFPGGPGRA